MGSDLGKGVLGTQLGNLGQAQGASAPSPTPAYDSLMNQAQQNQYNRADLQAATVDWQGYYGNLMSNAWQGPIDLPKFTTYTCVPGEALYFFSPTQTFKVYNVRTEFAPVEPEPAEEPEAEPPNKLGRLIRLED